MMGWLSKLIVVDNLGCPKCKQNSAEFFGKKKLPSNKEDMLGSFNIDRVVQFGILHKEPLTNSSWIDLGSLASSIQS
jgi:hypothetical protein